MLKKIVLASVFFILFICMTAMADTIFVGDLAEYKSVTDAVAAANDGDEIIISAGVYDESKESFPIEVDKSVYIHAAEGANVLLKSPLTKVNMKLLSEGCKVENINFEFLRGSGMHILADNAVVNNCHFELVDVQWRETTCGLWLGGAKYASITNTEFVNTSIAIAGPPDLGTSKVAVLTALFEVGEDIEYFTTHNFENTKVNGRKLEYIYGLKDQEYTSDCGELIAVNCENVIFTELTVDNASIGFQLMHSKDCIIKDCDASDSGIFGIYVAKCDNCLISNINANNGSHGIDVRDSDCCIVDNCVANESGQGIFFSWCRDCEIKNCEVKKCGTGIFTAGGWGNSIDNCLVADNQLGIYYKGDKTCKVTNSIIQNNANCGIRIKESEAEVSNNDFADNFVCIILLNSNSSDVHDNTFERSTLRDIYFENCSSMEYENNIFTEELMDSQIEIVSTN